MIRNLLILGGSSDIGIAFIKKYESNYDNIFAHYCNNDSELKTINIGSKLKLFKADFSIENDILNFAIEISKHVITDIIHCPAMKADSKRFVNKEWHEFYDGLKVQLMSIIYVLKEAIPQMIESKHGNIVFVLSSYTQVTPRYLSDYVTSKYALLGLMRSLTAEYSDKGIRVNAISPSMIDTKFVSNIPDFVVQKNALDNPMKRNASTTDVINTLRFLLNDDSEYINGQNIIISGGSVF